MNRFFNLTRELTLLSIFVFILIKLLVHFLVFEEHHLSVADHMHANFVILLVGLVLIILVHVFRYLQNSLAKPVSSDFDCGERSLFAAFWDVLENLEQRCENVHDFGVGVVHHDFTDVI